MHEIELFAATAAGLLLLAIHGPRIVFLTLANEGLWFAVGCNVWCRAYRMQDRSAPTDIVKDNVRLALYVNDSIKTLWWGAVLQGTAQALVAHAVPNLWRGLLANASLASLGLWGANALFASKKAWVHIKDEPPVWVIHVCTIS